jgi:hypothetical protein
MMESNLYEPVQTVPRERQFFRNPSAKTARVRADLGGQAVRTTPLKQIFTAQYQGSRK